MNGETILGKEYAHDSGAYINDDVNRAQRGYFLSRNLLVIPYKVGTWADATKSKIWELPGRNTFTIQVVTVSGNAPSAGILQLQGSVSGGGEAAGASNWADIGSTTSCTTSSISAAITDNRLFRYYRFKVNTAVTGGNATVFLAMMGK